jgi:hypothetical protein
VLSEKTRATLAQLTEKALHEIPGRETIDKVTVIRGYVQLLTGHPSRKDYDANLTEALLDLFNIATRYRSELASRLEGLIAEIDRERLS